MTAIDVISALFLVFLGSLGVFRLPELWRNQIGLHPDQTPSWWIFGLPLWRGTVRLMPLGVPFAFVGAVGTVADALDIEWLYRAAAIPGAALLLLAVTVDLFNLPKRVVVPHLRHQPGTVPEWLGAAVSPTELPRTLLNASRESTPRSQKVSNQNGDA